MRPRAKPDASEEGEKLDAIRDPPGLVDARLTARFDGVVLLSRPGEWEGSTRNSSEELVKWLSVRLNG